MIVVPPRIVASFRRPAAAPVAGDRPAAFSPPLVGDGPPWSLPPPGRAFLCLSDEAVDAAARRHVEGDAE